MLSVFPGPRPAPPGNRHELLGIIGAGWPTGHAHAALSSGTPPATFGTAAGIIGAVTLAALRALRITLRESLPWKHSPTSSASAARKVKTDN